MIEEALTFDDVLIVPLYSSILPSEVKLKSKISRNIEINVPLISAAMDTVTGHRLAIAMALEGGIGIIHRNMTIDQQSREVSLVKRYQSGMIIDPHILHPQDTVGKAQSWMNEKGVSGFPIVEKDGKLVGILTRRDLESVESADIYVREVMTTIDRLITAPIGTIPEEAKKILAERRIEKLPLVDKKGYLKGLITKKDIQKNKSFPEATRDEKGKLRVGAAVGSTGDFLERACELIKNGTDVIVIDSSHGHSKNIGEALIELKNMPKTTDVIAGNIATKDAALYLIQRGADGLKVGIGPGSICTTRIVTGCGVPQLTALHWVRNLPSWLSTEYVESTPIIADGGIKYSGDIVKAIAAGAHAVMIGSLFAGTDEAPGEKIRVEGRHYKEIRGMGSDAVLRQGGDRYEAKGVSEGIEGIVPYRGSLSDVFRQLAGGLRQGMGYTGSCNIHELRDQNRTKFIKISAEGRSESHVHGVLVTKEAPNYQPPTESKAS